MTKLGPWRPAHRKALLPDWSADELDAEVEAGRGTRAELVRAAVCYGINGVDAEFNRELKRLGGADPEAAERIEARMAGAAWRPPRIRVSGIGRPVLERMIDLEAGLSMRATRFVRACRSRRRSPNSATT